MGANRRQHTRFDVALAAEIKTDTRTFEAKTRNLSVGGCCIESPYALQEDGSVRVALFLVVDGIEDESLPPLACAAHVQWVVPPDPDTSTRHTAGLRFEGLSAEQKSWLEQFLNKTGAGS